MSVSRSSENGPRRYFCSKRSNLAIFSSKSRRRTSSGNEKSKNLGSKRAALTKFRRGGGSKMPKKLQETLSRIMRASLCKSMQGGGLHGKNYSGWSGRKQPSLFRNLQGCSTLNQNSGTYGFVISSAEKGKSLWRSRAFFDEKRRKEDARRSERTTPL